MRFSTLALASAGAVAASGALSAWFDVGAWGALRATSYGRFLLVKVAIVVLVLGLGWWNRSRLTRLVSSRLAILATVRGEAVLGVSVLGLTVLVGLVPGRDAVARPYSANLDDGAGTVTVTVELATPGENVLHPYFFDELGQPVSSMRRRRKWHSATSPLAGSTSSRSSPATSLRPASTAGRPLALRRHDRHPRQARRAQFRGPRPMKMLATLTALVFRTVWLVSPLRAGAHDETGTITVAATAAGPLTMAYDVDVTYLNDGHGAVDATATVVAQGPAGQEVGPIALEPGTPPGRYRATVVFPAPGEWLVRFSSLSPLASVERVESLRAPVVPSTAAPSTSTSGVAPTLSRPPSATVSSGLPAVTGAVADGRLTVGSTAARSCSLAQWLPCWSSASSSCSSRAGARGGDEAAQGACGCGSARRVAAGRAPRADVVGRRCGAGAGGRLRRRPTRAV
ncbi:MAG: hypothetical protein GEV08_13375 [Acidimicrobiia bacterium]|nr:hypothetical protein [Acidimicrobiia bacterium]